MKTESFDRHPKTLNGVQIRAQSLSNLGMKPPNALSKVLCLELSINSCLLTVA